MTQEKTIYKCPAWCTVALPADCDTEPSELYIETSGLGFPECDGCTYTKKKHVVFGNDGSIRMLGGMCCFDPIRHSHKDLVPHACSCGGTCRDPEPPATPKEPEPESTQEYREWNREEVGAIVACANLQDAYTRYEEAFPGKRNRSAIKQKYYSLQNRGKLLEKNKKVVVVAGKMFIGQTGIVTGFADGKKAVNIRLSAGGVLQTDLGNVEVTSDD